MIEIQFGAWQTAIAVLTGVAVARENVEARKSYMAFRHPLISCQQQHPRHPDEAVYDSQPLVLDFEREIAPTVEVERVVLIVNGFRHTLIKQGKCALYRSDVNRQI